MKVRGFGIRQWPIKRELTRREQTYRRNINNALVSLTCDLEISAVAALVSLTCDLEISAVAESSMAPFSTNTPSPVIHVTQQITCNFHYSTRGLSPLSRGITKRRNHSNESYCSDVMLSKAIDSCAINTYWRRALSYKGQTSVKCIKTLKRLSV